MQTSRNIRDNGVLLVANSAQRLALIPSDGFLVEQLNDNTLWAWNQSGQVWVQIGSGGGGGGTVTSVALALPSSVFTISGSPITTSGTLTGSFNAQTQNLIFASPNGSTGVPTFRGMVTADLPTATLVTAYLNQFTSTLQGVVPGSGGGTFNFLRADGQWATPPGATYTFADSLVNTAGTVTLVNDTGSPSPSTYYGTSSSSVLGYYNISALPFQSSLFTSVASANATTTLTSSSSETQQLTGGSSQTFRLPNATTLTLGRRFNFINDAGGTLTIQNTSGGNISGNNLSGGRITVACSSIATANGTWTIEKYAPTNANWGTSSLQVANQIIVSGSQGGVVAQFNAAGGGVQAASILQVVSDSTVAFAVNNNGNANVNGNLSVFGTRDTQQLWVRGFTGQASSVIRFQDSSSNDMFTQDNSGGAIFTSSTALTTPLIVKGASGQASDFFAVKNSANITLFEVGSNSTVSAPARLQTPVIIDLSGNNAIGISIGQRLLVSSDGVTNVMDFDTKQKAINSISLLTTKGDLLGFDGTNSGRFSVGSNGQIPYADSSQTFGIRWDATPATAPVYPTNHIPFGDGSTAGGITSANLQYDGTNLSAGPGMVISSNFMVIGSGILDNSVLLSYDALNRAIVDSASVVSVDGQNRQLKTGGNSALDWSSGNVFVNQDITSNPGNTIFFDNLNSNHGSSLTISSSTGDDDNQTTPVVPLLGTNGLTFTSLAGAGGNATATDNSNNQQVTGGNGDQYNIFAPPGGSATSSDASTSISGPATGGDGGGFFSFGGDAGGAQVNDNGGAFSATGGNCNVSAYLSGNGGPATSVAVAGVGGAADGGLAGVLYVASGKGGDATTDDTVNGAAATAGNSGDIIITSVLFGSPNATSGSGPATGGNTGNINIGSGIAGSATSNNGGTAIGGSGTLVLIQGDKGGTGTSNSGTGVGVGGDSSVFNVLSNSGGDATVDTGTAIGGAVGNMNIGGGNSGIKGGNATANGSGGLAFGGTGQFMTIAPPGGGFAFVNTGSGNAIAGNAATLQILGSDGGGASTDSGTATAGNGSNILIRPGIAGTPTTVTGSTVGGTDGHIEIQSPNTFTQLIIDNLGVQFDQLTTNRATFINSNNALDISTTTDTELGYLTGVTSSIQTQLNSITSIGVTLVTPAIILNGQTASIASTTIFTVPADGQYRASMYLEDSSAGVSGSLVSGSFNYTSSAGNAQTRTPISNLGLTVVGNSADGNIFIDAQSGTDIQYSTTFVNGVGSPAYNLRITLEKIS